MLKRRTNKPKTIELFTTRQDQINLYNHRTRLTALKMNRKNHFFSMTLDLIFSNSVNDFASI